MRVLPRFSLRQLFLLTFLGALVAWLGSQAVVGSMWAIAFSVAILFLGGLFILYAVLFLVAWPLSQYTQRWGSEGSSPFMESPELPVE
jgi:hypothetical protein